MSIRLCQLYTTYFCHDAEHNKFADFVFDSVLSARRQRVAIGQAAGIAKSWRSNKEAAEEAFNDALASYLADKGAGTLETKQQEPTWKEWNVPQLKATSIQANQNVALLEPSTDSSFDYWLRISTLERGKPIQLFVKLFAYHKRALGNLTPNNHATLTRNQRGWWLTLTVDEEITSATDSEAESKCFYVDRGNRPNQQTFCCRVCGFATNADINAASNIASRVGDMEISACSDREELKTLLQARHANRVSQLPEVQLPTQQTSGLAGVG